MQQPVYYYVVLRKDLQNVHYTIQASHAAMEMGMRMAPEDKVLDAPLHVCLLEVQDESELISVWRALKMSGLYESKDFTVFFEPDRNDGWTCLTTRPLKEHERRLFKDYQMFTTVETVLNNRWPCTLGAHYEFVQQDGVHAQRNPG